MNFMPIIVKIENKKILIVGAGNVALNKIKIIKQFSNNITIISPVVKDEILNFNLNVIKRKINYKDLLNYDIIYCCSNNKRLNEKIANYCKKRNKLVNVVDNPELSSFISPAIFVKDYMTVSVSSTGVDVKKSIRWRDKIRDLVQYGEIN